MFALLTSDPNLTRCELARIEGQVSFEPEGKPGVLGVGVFDDDQGLLRHCALDPDFRLDRLELRSAKAVLVHAARLPPSVSLEEGCQPHRYHGWMFIAGGPEGDSPARREWLAEHLPTDLRQTLRGASEGDRVFGHFLSRVRSTGQLENPWVPAEVAAEALLHALGAVETAAKAAQEPERPGVNLLATNGRVLVAVRAGEAPLHFKLLEGTERCARCGVGAGAATSPELRQEHRVCRSVVLASGVQLLDGWAEVPRGTQLLVDADLNVRQRPVPQRGP